MFPKHLTELVESLLKTCSENSLRVTVAESCTGGLVSALISSVPVASAIFGRGFITYSNASKGEMLSVPAHIFMAHGAVSEACAKTMAEGAVKNSTADLSVAITGIAGPGGATETKPVGLVYVSTARKGCDTLCEEHYFKGDRTEVRMQAVEVAMKMLNAVAKG